MEQKTCKHCGEIIPKYLSADEHEHYCSKNPKYKRCSGCRYLCRNRVDRLCCLVHQHNTLNCQQREVRV